MKHPALWIACLLTVLITAPVTAQTLTERMKQDEIVRMQDEEPAMRRAFERARTTLDAFLKLAKSPPAHYVGFAVKVGIRDQGHTEYFWITGFTQEGDRFSGTIANTPRLVSNVKENDRYQFTKLQIVDWMYIDRAKPKLVGNFTMCALLTKEPPAEAEAVRKRFNLDCD